MELCAFFVASDSAKTPRRVIEENENAIQPGELSRELYFDL